MSTGLPHDHGAGQLIEHLSDTMPSADSFRIVADIFRMLDDPSRLQIFWTLCHVEECVINLASLLGISSPALSHHLKLLKASRLIVSRRDGKEVYYTAADTEEVRMLHHAVEQVMMISCPERQRELCSSTEIDTAVLSPQEKTIQAVHEYLLAHLDERITIEDLSRMFLMNATTLKSQFKKLYGTSIAAHVKQHRLKKAAELLTESDMAVAEIARAVGYASQGKFSAAFLEYTGYSPLDYRKRHCTHR
ncbi:MAG: metalloregulator ArsR/SmtB family transcription factor [Ruminococcaceae bacterium]|nr:metalloregulator ArsR/SmtB family transcription factor [Oscillospiraceae bacterium]